MSQQLWWHMTYDICFALIPRLYFARGNLMITPLLLPLMHIFFTYVKFCLNDALTFLLLCDHGDLKDCAFYISQKVMAWNCFSQKLPKGEIVGYLNWLNFAKTNILTRCWKTCYNIIFIQGNLAHLWEHLLFMEIHLKSTLNGDLIWSGALRIRQT